MITMTKVASYVDVSNKALKVAYGLIEKLLGERAKFQQKSAELSKQLVRLGWIDEHQEKSASAKLSDPLGCLEVLENSLARAIQDRQTAKQAAAINNGGPSGQAVASRPRESNYVGEMRTTKTAADVAMIERLGLKCDAEGTIVGAR